MPTSIVAIVLATGVAVTALWFGAAGTADYVRIHAVRLTLLVIITIGLTSANLIIRWARWNFLVRRLEVRVPARDSVRIYFATLPALATPFYVGELVRAALLTRRFPQSPRVVFFVWSVERLTDAVTLLLFALIARGHMAWGVAVVGCWAAAATITRAIAPTSRTRQIARPSVLAVLLASSMAAWLLPVAALDCALAALNGPVGIRTAADAVASGTLLGGVAGVPLGTGVTGSAAIIVLEGHGAPPALAAAAVTAFRAGTAWYAVGLGLLTLLIQRRKLTAFVRSTSTSDHFNNIAAKYEDQIPAHIRQRLLDRKVAFMHRTLGRRGLGSRLRGLDVGCGHGWYACEMATLGYDIDAFDRSANQILHAERHAASSACRVRFRTLDADELPWPDDTFDFVYSINVLHHITPPSKRTRVMAQIVRVLKPGGVFFLHEINVQNPIFRLYMDYVFPLLCPIDEGTEEWLEPNRLPDVPNARWARAVDYFTFLPDFTPLLLLLKLGGLEAWLERSTLRRWSAHYIARLEKYDRVVPSDAQPAPAALERV